MERPPYRFIRKHVQKEAKLIVNVHDAVAICIVLCQHDNSARIEIQTLHCANLKKCVTEGLARKVNISRIIATCTSGGSCVTAAKLSVIPNLNIVEVVELV